MTDNQQQGKPQEQAELFFQNHGIKMTGVMAGEYIDKEDFLKFASSIPTEEQKEEDVFIKSLDWLACFEATHPNSEIVDKIILCSGEYYWDSDIDGDQPLSGKDLYKIFKSKSSPSPVHTIENKEDEKLK